MKRFWRYPYLLNVKQKDSWAPPLFAAYQAPYSGLLTTLISHFLTSILLWMVILRIFFEGYTSVWGLVLSQDVIELTNYLAFFKALNILSPTHLMHLNIFVLFKLFGYFIYSASKLQCLPTFLTRQWPFQTWDSV